MNFRNQVLQAGASLGLREVGGLIIRLGGVVALTHLLGPTRFGIYAGSVAVVGYLTTVAQFGTEVYLLRREHEPSQELYSEVFTFLVATSLATGLLAFGASFLVEAAFADNRSIGVFQVMLISLPLNILWVPAASRIERAFRFRAIAVVEIGGDAVLYGVSVTLVAIGAGVWGPVIGYLSWQAWLLVTSFALAPQRIRLRLPRERLAELLGSSGRLSSWILLDRAVGLVNPLVVGGFLGAASVGYVTLAARLADTLTFVTRASFRLSLAAFGRVQQELPRLQRGLEEAMVLQALACGPLLAGFAVIAAWLIPAVFGNHWDPALRVFPFVALFYLGEVAFALQGQVLMVRGLHRAAIQTIAIRLVVLVCGSLVLVPLTGIIGYGLAAVASLINYAAGAAAVRRLLFQVKYGDLTVTAVAFVPPLFAPLVPAAGRLALVVPALFILALPRARSRLRVYLNTAIQAVRGAQDGDSASAPVTEQATV